ncbi:MAG: urate oxidase, partial [Chloroflexi bacterium]
MTIRLGENQYGKAETHMVRVTKSDPFGSVHEIKDINVSIALMGDFAGSH